DLDLQPEDLKQLHRQDVAHLGQMLRETDPPPAAASGRRSVARKPSPLAPALRSCLQEHGYPDEWFTIDGTTMRFRIQDAAKVTITLSQAKQLIQGLAPEQSLLLQAAPGVGKTAIVSQAAAEMGLPCKSLLGTQIAPEDVSGIPRIVGERSVFCPPRVLLPEQPEAICL